ncbi:cupin domain-containing protein [Streptomyces sp. NPDC021225]|uniref:cupin domain-containing protein n=1 Tax=Streptomyces sp. NPDC021225 TaxID=3365121 RepID=UPI0037BCE1B6
MDLLRDHLARARAGGAVFAWTVAEPPWGLRLAGTIQLSVQHTVVRGRGWLWFDADDPGHAVELVLGEVTLVRGGTDHYVGHEPGTDCLEPEEFRARHAHDGESDTPGRRCSSAVPTDSPTRVDARQGGGRPAPCRR